MIPTKLYFKESGIKAFINNKKLRKFTSSIFLFNKIIRNILQESKDTKKKKKNGEERNRLAFK